MIAISSSPTSTLSRRGADKPDDIRQSVIDIATDYLAVGIDPNKSTLFIQSEVPAIDELTFFFAMLLPFNRVMRNPTLKDEIRDKDLGDEYSFGFPLYAVGQVCRHPGLSPGARSRGRGSASASGNDPRGGPAIQPTYCGVDPHAEDKDYLDPRRSFSDHRTKARPRPAIGRHRCARTGRATSQDEQIAQQRDFPLGRRRRRAEKSDGMYTDPKRIRATDPGTVENNPLWIFHETFNPDKAWVAQHQEAYREGKVGDVVIKQKLVDVLNALIEPIRSAESSTNPGRTMCSTPCEPAPAEPMSLPKKPSPWRSGR